MMFIILLMMMFTMAGLMNVYAKFIMIYWSQAT